MFPILRPPFVYISGTFGSGKTHLCETAEKLLGETWSIWHREYKGLDFPSLVRTRAFLISNVFGEALLYNATEIADGTCLVLNDSISRRHSANTFDRSGTKETGIQSRNSACPTNGRLSISYHPQALASSPCFTLSRSYCTHTIILSRGIQIIISPISNELSDKIGNLQGEAWCGVLGEEEIREKYTAVWGSIFDQDEKKVYFDMEASGYTISNIKSDQRGWLHIGIYAATLAFMREYRGSWDTAEMRKNWDGDHYHIVIPIAKEDLEKAIEIFYSG